MERLRFKDDNGNQFPEWIKTRNKEVLKERKEFANKGIGFEHLSLTKEGVVEKSARYERDFLVRETNKNYKVTRIGDLCYNPANLKFGVITLNENKDGIFSPIYVTFEIKPRVSWLFAKYFYIRDQYIKKLLKFEEGTVYERKAVKPYDFLNHNISVPVIEEQEKIGNFLSLFDRFLEKINEKIYLLKELKKGYLQQMFTAKGEKIPRIRFFGNGNSDKNLPLGGLIEEYNDRKSVDENIPILSSTMKGIYLQTDYFTKNTASENTIGYKKVPFGYFTYRSMSDTGSFTFNIQELVPVGIVSPAYPVFKSINIDNKFLYYYLNQSKRFKSELLKSKQGGTRYALSFKLLKELNISVPSQLEQEKIGNFLSLFDRLLEKINEKIDLLKELKKGYLQQMFPAKGEKVPWIRFSGFEDDWEQNKFNQVVLRVSTQSNSSHLPRVEYEDIIAGEGRLNKDVLQMMKNKKGLEFFKEDILYGKLRPYLKNWLLADFNGIAVGDFWILRPKNTYSKFIYNLIQTENFQDIANLSAGSKMPRSDWSIVSKKQFYIPNSRLEQEKIGNFLSSLDKQVENIKNYSKEVESLKKGYMQRLFA